MRLKRRGQRLVEFWLAWVLMLGALTAVATRVEAQGIATTTVADTVYRADGTGASGSALISWPAFTTAAGSSVPAGKTSVTIGAGGALSVALVPNAGSTPMGSYYTVVYHLDDGSVTREYWVVPVSAGAVRVSAIRSTVLPASVAMQTVSKSYVDTAIAAAATGHPLDSSPYVVKTGDTMTGPLVLAGDPASALQASDKRYVDAQVAGLASGLGQKVSEVPQGTQVVVQPAGTQLEVNNLNGVEYASQYANGAGNNGIANAAAGADCASGCEIKAEQTYNSNETPKPATWNNRTQLEDARSGARMESFNNPLNVLIPGANTGHSIDVVSTQTAQQVLAATGASEQFSTGLTITSEALAGGSNVYPKGLQSAVPYFKTTFGALNLKGTNNTLGQHVLSTQLQNCYGVGDCLMGGLFMTASGGFRDDADEGSHPFDLVFGEDTQVFRGTCSGGCAPGAMTVQVAVTAGAGTQGEGRYLMDTNPAKVLTDGAIVGYPRGPVRQPGVDFAGTNFALSVLLETAQTIPTQANSINPGTVTVPIVTSGVPQGFATNTAALPSASGVACVSDQAVGDGRPLNFETAAYTVNDGSHLQMTLTRPHGNGATVAVGGLCGYGLEQTVDTMNGIRQVFPVIASTTPTELLYAGGASTVVGQSGVTSAYVNANIVLTTLVRSGNVVTATSASDAPGGDLSGLRLTISGVTDPSYNGTFVVTQTGRFTYVYANTGPDSTSTGGTATYLTGGYALYPMAEVLNVFNQGTKAVDGQLTLAANTVPWAAGDSVEEPHYFQEQVAADTTIITQFVPRPRNQQSAGLLFQGNNGPGLQGWSVENGVGAGAYFGHGGTHLPPSAGFAVRGIWQNSMEMQAGESGVIRLHCNSRGCDKFNSGYDLFQMDTSVGLDRMSYTPATSTLTLNLRGTQYTFDPSGLTAGTINVGTLHAGTVTGGTGQGSGAVFGASGPGHAAGAVPDPGPVAGTAKYLREDGVFATPAGTGGGTGGGASGYASITGGTIDNTVIGGSVPSDIHATSVSLTGQSAQFRAMNEDNVFCKFCNFFSGGSTEWGQGQLYYQTFFVASNGAPQDSLGFYVGAVPDGTRAANATATMYPSGMILRNGTVLGFSTSTTGASVAGELPAYTAALSAGGGTGQLACGNGTAGDASCTFNAGAANFSGDVRAANLRTVLAGTTGAIGGSALAAGNCASATATVNGAAVGAGVVVSAADGTLPGAAVMVRGAVTSGGTVTVQVCAVSATTPAVETYNVRVIQ